MKDWKLDFKKAFLSSFKDEDLCHLCINWIELFLIKYPEYYKNNFLRTSHNFKLPGDKNEW